MFRLPCGQQLEYVMRQHIQNCSDCHVTTHTELFRLSCDQQLEYVDSYFVVSELSEFSNRGS
jgi:hypothetical protein